jgi:hypothetical protein
MCASSLGHHGTTHDDFERLDRSRYRLRPYLAATGPDYQGERLDHGAQVSGWTWHDGYQA